MTEEKQNKFRNLMVVYLNTTLNRILIFFIISILLFILSNIFFKIKNAYLFPIAFIIVIALSPLFSRLNWGEKIINKYEHFLLNFLNKEKK